MADELASWVNAELTKLLCIDVASVQDITNYLVSLTDQEELVEFVKELLNGSSESTDLNGPQREFVNNLIARWRRKLVPENVTVYRKDNADFKAQEKPTNAKKVAKNPFDMREVQDSLEDSSPGKKGKKKTSFVSLYGKDGEMRTNAVMLPGRNSCECQAQKHKLVSNCLGCGRVVCEQEGSGPCLFCGALVCTREEKEIIARKSNKGEKLHQKLLNKPGGKALTKAENDANIMNALEKARAYKERLLNYDRTCAQRTKVIDDEADYYAADGNIWLSEKERKHLKRKEDKIREMRHGSRLNKKFTIDFAGREVVEDTYEVMLERVGQEEEEDFSSSFASLDVDSKENFPGLANPNVKGILPKFVAVKSQEPQGVVESAWSKPNNRLQDKQLLEMSDPGCCLSMHQPWASLLVAGIKKDEGRSWYSNHRGRLWIAAAAKQPTKDEIFAVEQQHKAHWVATGQANDMPSCPTEYPVGCLLGCVHVKDVLSQEEYIKSYPHGESGAAFVFVCENPFELAFKFPVKGKIKIWRLDPKIHKTAKAALKY